MIPVRSAIANGEQVFLNTRHVHKRGQKIRIGTADKVMIPVAFCF